MPTNFPPAWQRHKPTSSQPIKSVPSFAPKSFNLVMAICLAEGDKNGARLPVTALVDQFYAQVQARGGNCWDTSSLIHLLAND